MSVRTFSGVDEVRGDVATVKLQPLDDLQLIVQSLPILTKHSKAQLTEHSRSLKSVGKELNLTFTVMTPLRPTFFIALEMMLPISTSPLAEIVAT